jgi:hypothetical protein
MEEPRFSRSRNASWPLHWRRHFGVWIACFFLEQDGVHPG